MHEQMYPVAVDDSDTEEPGPLPFSPLSQGETGNDADRD